jgi:hypothetical protein
MAELLQRNPILALDISSTCTGAAAYYRGKLIIRDFPVKGDYSRILKMGDMFASFLDELSCEHQFPDKPMWDIWAEEPFYVRKGSFDLPIKMAHGVLMYAAHEYGLKFAWNYVSVNTWRAEYKLHKEKDKKTPVMEAMSRRFNIVVPNGDIGDALGILNWRMKEAGVTYE